jgi:hypothetical protein
MRCVLSVVLATLLVTASLAAQTQACPQSGGGDAVDSCGGCLASTGEGITIECNCSTNCQEPGLDCPQCCFECEANVTFDDDYLNRLVVVKELKSNPPRNDSDSAAPFNVSLEVKLTCVQEGGEGTQKCVEFMAEHNGQGGSDPWQRTKLCFRLLCDPCQ